MAYFVKRAPDANHKEVVSTLEQLGVHVVDLASSGSGICDLVTFYRGETVFIEVKCGKVAELKRTQIHFLAEWPGPCGIARDADEAYQLATEPGKYALSPIQKTRLAVYARTMEQKKVHLNTILKHIELFSTTAETRCETT